MRLISSSVLLFGLLMLTGSAFATCEHLTIDTSQGTVRDTDHGLVWSRCLFGQTGGECFGDAKAFSWVDSLNKARGSELGGITNWRLPKIDELEKLYRTGCIAVVFPGKGTASVWSASANLDYATDAWSFDFGQGKGVVRSRDTPIQLLLVATPN